MIVIIELDYKSSYSRYALTVDEFREEFIKARPEIPEPDEEPQSFTTRPMVHIWYKLCDIDSDEFKNFFTDMTWGLCESDIDAGNIAHIDYDACQSLRKYIPRLDITANAKDLTTDECLEIFKKYDKTCYEYYMSNMYFFGYSARNYAVYLKNKFSADETTI